MLSKSGFLLTQYWRTCLSKHVFDTDANGCPLDEKLNSLIVIPAQAGKFMINFTYRRHALKGARRLCVPEMPKVESEALIQKINF